ncbi:CPBP family intramembrane glutamic endopeptidase [Lysobacter sp. CFH 32150]|uniref:CPBP family intramembrane glutamic endopeptidase n=1 Tax=Lysobacter sp. CFH 32150 TaxID=2927128 RepID=UPI001FA7E18A|nr:CPBP family intramembrane glutamic endopeptidase [Lysobacter sp. CFH 32150]MCI4568994.1 CPBP family intramembrane metalloprotease [Lysobacter sp. CFH 32150]
MDAQATIPGPPWNLDVRTAALWGLLAGLSAMAVMPYLMQLTPQAFEGLRIPLPALVALQGLQAFVLLGLLSLLGLRMGHRVGLGSPLLQTWLARRAIPGWRTLKPVQSIAIGAIFAVIVLGASLLLDPLLPKPLHAITDTGKSALNGLLASFYGGIAEELQLRLFLMTLLVWSFTAFGRRQPRVTTYWVAIVIAALLFGVGHLPAAAKLWGLSDIVVFRTIALNAVVGLAFGWLYWRRGIEMAMLGHFSADIVLHVLAPMASMAPTG